MSPLPYKNALKYRTRENVCGISILVSIQNVPQIAAQFLPRAVLRIGLFNGDRIKWEPKLTHLHLLVGGYCAKHDLGKILGGEYAEADRAGDAVILD
jgi:hypothetical protein